MFDTDCRHICSLLDMQAEAERWVECLSRASRIEKEESQPGAHKAATEAAATDLFNEGVVGRRASTVELFSALTAKAGLLYSTIIA